MSGKPVVLDLILGGVATSPTSIRIINLRDLGFDGRVSEEARAEIAAAERRAMRVLTTAHLYWFGSGQ